MMKQRIKIIELGAEGGGLDIYLADTFTAVIDESTLNDFLDDDDPGFAPHVVAEADTLAELLQKLDKYRWHHLHLVCCHESYVELLMQERELRIDMDRRSGRKERIFRWDTSERCT